MKVLFISNFYPPYYKGGYELGCRDVVDGLRTRGHDARVLTSTYGVKGTETDGHVYRWLYTNINRRPRLSGRLLALLRKETVNQSALERLVAEFRPDVVYIWNLAHISLSLLFLAQKSKLPVCLFVSDHWLTHWEDDSWCKLWFDSSQPAIVRWSRALLRPILRPFLALPESLPNFTCTHFVSDFLRREAIEAGQAGEHAEVIYWGLDLERFPFRPGTRHPARLLYSGQIAPHKGVHTAIEALRILVQERGCTHARLTIAGNGDSPDYQRDLADRVRVTGLTRHVHFIGRIPRERMAQVYRENDILIFPSVWDEPFSIALLEGMSSGLAVVGTATGGSAEILEHGVNAMVFPKENASSCAGHVLALVNDVCLFERVRRAGRRIVEQRYPMGDMIDRIERSLEKAASGQNP